jgi:hypothetical protein
VPTGRGRDALDAADLQQNLGPLVAQIVTTLSDCLISPTACPSTAVLTTAPTIVPQPTATTAVCPDDLHDCADACVDTDSDPDNCGQCGNGCGELTCCSGVCIDVSSDPDNCGECQGVCDSGLVCVEGSCTCDGGTNYCDGSCVDLLSDANNCGECAFVCPSGQVCVDGQCTCPEDSIPCADSCCDPGLECTDEVCVEPCDPSYLLCNGTCIDPSTHPTHCGACGNACSLPDCCGGQCTDVTNDPGNCGFCGNVCSTGEECQYGECYKVPA